MYGVERQRLGDILIASGLIDVAKLEEGLALQRAEGKKLGRVFVDKGWLTEDQLLDALSVQLGVPVVHLADLVVDPQTPLLVPEKLARRHNFLAVESRDDAVVIATSDPLNVQGIDDVRLMTGKDVELYLCREAEVKSALDEYFGSAESFSKLLEGEAGLELVKDETDFSKTGEGEAEENEVIKLVNLVILEALKNRASDVHLEPFEKDFFIRQRIDGVLQKMPSPPRRLQNALVSRIKVMADLNIAETRLPQDGRIKLRLAGKEVDLRVSCLPTMFGESTVLRVLDRGATILGLEQLGMNDEIRAKAEKIVANPNGVIIVTGPTGSGKTSSLYAFIQKRLTPEEKFITVEDPVEYELDGLVQVQVREKVGLTFAAALRSILRQDPDIVLIGEIRDVETAEIAIQASLTGHLVLTSLHTNDAAGSITRLIDMGIEPFLLTSTILGICGQRLIRTICPVCKEPYQPDPKALGMLVPKGLDTAHMTFFHGRGCPDCAGTGHKGRTGIFELLMLDESIQNLVLEKAPSNVIMAKARTIGMHTMAEDGWLKVTAGITTIEEVLRVAPAESLVQ